MLGEKNYIFVCLKTEILYVLAHIQTQQTLFRLLIISYLCAQKKKKKKLTSLSVQLTLSCVRAVERNLLFGKKLQSTVWLL